MIDLHGRRVRCTRRGCLSSPRSAQRPWYAARRRPLQAKCDLSTDGRVRPVSESLATDGGRLRGESPWVDLDPVSTELLGAIQRSVGSAKPESDWIVDGAQDQLRDADADGDFPRQRPFVICIGKCGDTPTHAFHALGSGGEGLLRQKCEE